MMGGGHGFGSPFGFGFGHHGSWSSLSSFGSCGSFGSFDWSHMFYMDMDMDKVLYPHVNYLKLEIKIIGVHAL